MSKFFDELMESVQQMNEILRDERKPPRELHADALQVKKISKAAGSLKLAANQTQATSSAYPLTDDAP